VLLSSEIGLLHFEVSNSSVSEPRHHRMCGESDHAPVSEDALRCDRSEPALCVRRILRSEGLCGFDFDVFREGADALDEPENPSPS
jgi:hypothetical protein